MGRMIVSVGRFRAFMYVKTQWIEGIPPQWAAFSKSREV
jgi:hypothetical protein